MAADGTARRVREWCGSVTGEGGGSEGKASSEEVLSEETRCWKFFGGFRVKGEASDWMREKIIGKVVLDCERVHACCLTLEEKGKIMERLNSVAHM